MQIFYFSFDTGVGIAVEKQDTIHCCKKKVVQIHD